MNSIKIKSLYLENFKCHQHLSLTFDGRDVSVYGDNATGKTSIYDAFTWLLFGKDSRGNGEKNIEIKPLNADGDVMDHQAMTIVEAVLLVGEEELSLRRTYCEVWATRRGSSEAVFDGNTSEYYINGVPCKLNAFRDKVHELVDEDTFRMLTSVDHFPAGISWQDRRAVLFDIAGVMDDREIMKTDEQFLPLLDSMGKLSVGDYRKVLQAEKKKFTGVTSDIPARISECQRTIQDVECLNFAAAREALGMHEVKKDDLCSRILAIENDTAIAQKRTEISALQLELSKLEAENDIFRQKQSTGSATVLDLQKKADMLRGGVARKMQLLANERDLVMRLEDKVDASRKRWTSVNGEIFSGGVCSSCGQTLLAERLQAAKDSFEASRRNRLREIEAEAASNKEALQAANDRIAGYEADIGDLNDQLQAVENELSAAEGKVVAVTDMEGYAERKASLEALIGQLNSQLANMADNVIAAKNDLQEQLQQTEKAIEEQNSILSKETLLDYSRRRIAELNESAKNANECLESIDRMLYLMEQYTRYKTGFIEDGINSQFRLAKFRLFREQANGGVEDRCDVVYDGVPYIGLNNGMKFNVGIDIINTLSRHYGVIVPLFVDNAEAVTKLETCAAQVIRLVVSAEDKELRVV